MPAGPAPHPLDRPIWNALATCQASLAAGSDLARRFQPGVSPLAAAQNAAAPAVAALAALIPAHDEISLLERTPPPAPPGVIVASSALCLQMTTTGFAVNGRDLALEALGDRDAVDMYALAQLTRPGPYRAHTHTLGRFLGIRDGAQLVAMAGERLHIDGFVEISAVCTHPDHRGRGYGAALMRAIGQRILQERATPFLHSYAANAHAIALYKHLGFAVRSEIMHVVWRRAG